MTYVGAILAKYFECYSYLKWELVIYKAIACHFYYFLGNGHMIMNDRTERR